MGRPRKELDASRFTTRFATRLKLLRERAGLTTKEAAEGLGVSLSSIYAWERGVSVPQLDLFPALAEAYSVKARTLLPDE